MNRLIFFVLRGGILLSIATILVGLLAQGVHYGPWPGSPVPVPLIPSEVASLTPAGLLSLGVFFLILTPIARVLLSLFIFAEEKDWTYVLITGIVFANLMAGVVIGLA